METETRVVNYSSAAYLPSWIHDVVGATTLRADYLGNPWLMLFDLDRDTRPERTASLEYIQALIAIRMVRVSLVLIPILLFILFLVWSRTRDMIGGWKNATNFTGIDSEPTTTGLKSPCGSAPDISDSESMEEHSRMSMSNISSTLFELIGDDGGGEEDVKVHMVRTMSDEHKHR